MRARFLAPVLVALTCVASAQAAVPDQWTRWQGGPETWVRSLDYVTPAQLVAGSEGDGVFSSTNAIGPWSDVSSSLTGAQRTVHQAVAQNGQVYLASSAGLFSGDGQGGGWTQLGVDPATPPGQQLNMGGVQSILFNSPTDMVVAIAGAGGPGVYYSSDAGAHWTRASGLTDATYYLTGGTF